MDYNKYYKNKKIKTKEKTKIERDHNIDNIESGAIDKAIYSLLLIALIIIPLFVKAHISEFISPKFTLLSSGFQADIFSYYKYIFLVIITIIIGILFIYKVMFLQYNFPKSKTNIFLGILAVVVILSAIFSPYKSIALHGMYNRHEGTLTFICYLMLFFVAANMKFLVKQVHWLLYCLYPFTIINMILGLFVISNKNILDIGWIKNFMLGSLSKEAQVSEGAKLVATLSNPNYISGVASVLTILFLVWAMFDKNRIRSIINMIMAVLSFITVLTSLSSSGFLTVLVLMPIAVFFIFVNQEKKDSALTLLAFVILVAATFVPLANKNPRVWDESFGFFLNTNPFEEKQVSSVSTKLANNALDIFKPIVVSADEGNKTRFSIPTLPKSGIGAGTGRAYEWKKTVEVSMERPLLGYGLDTFAYVFPQNDIEKKANLRKYSIIVDKPHNMYLGLLVGSGVIALLSFLILVGTVLYKSAVVILKRSNVTEERTLLLAVLSAVVAYLIQGLFNDSVVGSGVIFWILLGLLLSLTNKLKGN